MKNTCFMQLNLKKYRTKRFKTTKYKQINLTNTQISKIANTPNDFTLNVTFRNRRLNSVEKVNSLIVGKFGFHKSGNIRVQISFETKFKCNITPGCFSDLVPN